MSLTKNDITIIKSIISEQSKKNDLKFDDLTKKISQVEKNAADFRTYVREEFEHIHSRFDKTDRTIEKLTADFIEITGGILANHEMCIKHLKNKKPS